MKETRDHILKIAFSLFLKKNYKEVTMQEIVRESGLSKGAFYHYFNSKEQIFREIIDNAYTTFVSIDFSQFNKHSLLEFYRDYLNRLRQIGASFLNISKTMVACDINYYSLIFEGMRLFSDYRSKIMESSFIEMQEWVDVVHSARERSEIDSTMSDKQIANVFIHISSSVGMNNIVMNCSTQTVEEITELWDGLYSEIKK